ncbi:DUF4034 domain-containing protein [Cupriavidus sp. 2KB_3]|uniref:DUF4034 domain-containing protein n=1 Tax=Cupriavidus TaxID=106589 RepID=UPI0011EDB361|nr:DUF4034 domain-containing protein [Cupriavidus campinensis]
MLLAGNRPLRIRLFHKVSVLLGLFCALMTSAQANPTLVALDSRQFKQLDATLNGLQARFEAGQATEVELRDAFRPFYKLTPSQEAAAREWVRVSPNSYSAHLALGVFLRRRAGEARGNEFIDKTPPEKIARMRALLDEARPETERALALTPKPYLAAFHLLGISSLEGDRAASRRAIQIANKALPSNHLARTRYIAYITPRWGGSYPEMQAFIAQSKREGMDAVGLMLLVAIMYNDMGQSAMDKGDAASAYPYFHKALDLDKQNGGIFRKDYLTASKYYVCSVSRDSRYCN